MAEDQWLLTREQKQRVRAPGAVRKSTRALLSRTPRPPLRRCSTHRQDAERKTEQRAKEAARRLRQERQSKASAQNAPRRALAVARAREQRRAALVAAQHRETEQRREEQRCGIKRGRPGGSTQAADTTDLGPHRTLPPFFPRHSAREQAEAQNEAPHVLPGSVQAFAHTFHHREQVRAQRAGLLLAWTQAPNVPAHNVYAQAPPLFPLLYPNNRKRTRSARTRCSARRSCRRRRSPTPGTLRSSR